MNRSDKIAKKSKRRSSSYVPYGLKELVEAMSWAVIMERPEDTCQYLLNYTIELLQFRNENRLLDQREAIIQFHKGKDDQISDKKSSSGPAGSRSLSDHSFTPPEVAELLQDLLDETDDDRSVDGRVSTDFSEGSVTPSKFAEHLQEVPVDKADHLRRPLSQPKKSALQTYAQQTEGSKTDDDTCDQKKQLGDQVRTSSVQEGVLVSCKVTDTTLQDTPLDKDAQVSDEKSPDAEDSTYVSEVSPTTPEPADISLEAPPDKGHTALSEGDSSDRVESSQIIELSQTSPDIVELLQEAPLDKEDALLTDEKLSDAGDSTLNEDAILSKEDLTELTQIRPDIVDASVDKETAPISKKETSESVDSSYVTEPSQTPSEPVEPLFVAPLEKDDAPVSNEKSSDDVDSTLITAGSFLLPKPAELPMEASLDEDEPESDDGRDSNHFYEVSPSSHELLADVKILQANVLEDDSVDSSDLIEPQQTAVEFVGLIPGALPGKEDVTGSDENSSDDEDNSQFRQVGLTSPELVPDVEVLQEPPVEEAYYQPRPPSRPRKSPPSALKRHRITKSSMSDGETCNQRKESMVRVRSSSLQDDVLMTCKVTDSTWQEASTEKADYLLRPPSEPEKSPSSALKRYLTTDDSKSDIETCDQNEAVGQMTSSSERDGNFMSSEVTDTTMQETPPEKDDVPMSDEKLPDIIDSSYFTEPSQTAPEIEELLFEALLGKGAPVGYDKTFNGEESTYFSEVSVIPAERLPGILLLETQVKEADHLPRPPSQPDKSSPSALKRQRKTRGSKSDSETCDRKKPCISLSLQDSDLMTWRSTDQTQQEEPVDKEYAPASSEKSSDERDSTQFSTISPAPLQPATLLQEAPLTKDDDKSFNGDDSTQFGHVRLTPQKLYELLQEVPKDEADVEMVLSGRESPDGRDSRHSGLTSPEQAVLYQKALSDEADTDKSDGKDNIYFRKVSPTPPAMLLQEATPDEADAFLSIEKSSKVEESAHFTTARLASPELGSDVKRELAAVGAEKLQSEVPSHQVPSFVETTKRTRKTLLPKRLPSATASSSISSSSSSSSLSSSPCYPRRRLAPKSPSDDYEKDSHLQRPDPSQRVRARTSENEEVTVFRLPHRREEGVLSTEVLLQPQYRNGASIRIIGPGSVVIRGWPMSKSQTHQRCTCGQC
ncbi:hypothetical protein Baya_8441 [Bagarius yarrelli]|uniref:Uncharacterized protein n=1 Tax=Bagarius yarrelli TaxID=175774 RepID=A0A556U5P0_BAGYA|nr:hypothetical protein Baya_8441 [Bagarius yarrelli]